jgi:hypothetical protein
MAWSDRPNANKHVALPKCAGATVVTTRYYLGDEAGRRPAPAAGGVVAGDGATVIHGDHNTVVHIQIVTSDALDYVARAGTAAEAEGIRRTLLENAALQRALSTLENLPGAVFGLTGGKNGSLQLRNAKADGRNVKELRPEGERVVSKKAYSKETAQKLLDQVKHVVDSLDSTARASPAVREWADSMRRELARRPYLNGSATYEDALRLYTTGNPKLYSLAKADREAIMGGVNAIGELLAKEYGA